jgi:protein-L-isoaspartate(D-aspartate) O-methyltransferase
MVSGIPRIGAACASLALAAACADGRTQRMNAGTPDRAAEREAMVARQIAPFVTDARVLDALRTVPRHRFVPASEASAAYGDHPLPIGFGQTISQPFIVASMSATLELDGSERVLEVGTGSGYQAAVLGRLAAEVWTIEIVAPLAERAGETLAALGYANVHVRAGDGYRGWPAAAPFDAILVAAAAEDVPRPLLEQLAPGGLLVMPVGALDQELVLVRRTAEGFERRRLYGVRFVPMTGEVRR